MKIIVIGSSCFSEVPRDLDILCEHDGVIHPFERCDILSTKTSDRKWIFSGKLNDFLVRSDRFNNKFPDHDVYMPNTELLAHIYRSHLTSKRKKWFSHYRTFHQGFCEVYKNSTDSRLFSFSKEREKEYREESGTRSWTLKGMTKENFFGDNVKYYQDHDSVHKAIAFENGIHAYTYMQEKSSEVECKKSLFDQMSFRRQLNCVKEEMAVIAIERFIAPLYFSGDVKNINIVKALRGSLFKLNTTLSSGWFQEFCVINGYSAYQELVNDMSWMTRWIEKTKSGEILS